MGIAAGTRSPPASRYVYSKLVATVLKFDAGRPYVFRARAEPAMAVLPDCAAETWHGRTSLLLFFGLVNRLEPDTQQTDPGVKWNRLDL